VVLTDVSEERIASIFRVEGKNIRNPEAKRQCNTAYRFRYDQEEISLEV
jgi:hypothetical protein